MNENNHADTTPERRAEGLEIMRKVYGWDQAGSGTGDFHVMTVEHLFAEVWSREGISDRDRRLLLIGLLLGQGLDEELTRHLDAALRTRDLTPDELREITVFITHYAGWPRGARLNSQVEDLIERLNRD